MSGKVRIIETTLRDGQQSLWATRMTTAMLLPMLPVLDRGGFAAIEFMGQAVMDSCVRWLQENPWERFRLVRERVRQTPLMMINGGLSFSVGRGALPDDMLALFYTTCAEAGIDEFFVLDGLNDLRNLEIPLRAAHAAGAIIHGTIVYSISPIHTDEYFVGKVRELVRMGFDTIVLKDPNGALTPERVRTLVPAVIAAAGNLPCYIHSHCVTGLGPAVNLEAIRLGMTGMWTSASPLANGSSLPATESMVRHLERMGYDTGVDPEAADAIARHFRTVAERHQKPIGKPAEYDPSFYLHQMPGGMISNFRAQLAQLGLENRLDEVLEEIPQVRADLGWSLMVTPFSQIIGTQSALNVLYGRYKVIINDVERLVLGHFGQTPAPINPAVLEQAGRGQQPTTARAAAHVPPGVERFRQEHGPFKSDQELLLAYFFMPEQLKAMYAAGPVRTDDTLTTSPLVELVRTVARQPDVKQFYLVM